MAVLTCAILSDDETFKRRAIDLLRSGATPVSIGDERQDANSVQSDLVIVDGCGQQAGALATIERMRMGAPSVAIFMVAPDATPDLILQSMRAGANEFFTWPLAEAAFHEAIARATVRRSSSSEGKPLATTLAFFGAKGGAGTTTVAVNCG